MKFTTPRMLSVLCGLICLFIPRPGHAANFPERPVHLVLGFSTGGGTDLVARLIANGLSKKWGQSVVVDNKPGADGSIAADFVARAIPDGYTLDLVTLTHTVVPNLYKINYDPIKSFTPIIMLATTAQSVLVVNPLVPANNLREFIAFAKSNPGRLNFGSGGVSTPGFLNMALFMQATGIKMTHIPFNGGGPAVVAALGNEVQSVFLGVQDLLPHIRAGKLRALGFPGKERSPDLPDVPTIAEGAGLSSFDGAINWEGMLAPAGTPNETIKKIHDDMAEVVRSSEVQETLVKQGFVTVAGPSDEFAAFLQDNLKTWAAVLKEMDTK